MQIQTPNLLLPPTNPTTSFQKMLHDFINVQTTKTNMGAHKNLQRSIQLFTKTIQCWQEAILVLQIQHNPNVLALCASILKNKLQFDFSQLNDDTFRVLHESILNIIANKNGSMAMRNHLSVCIAFIYIHKFEEIGDLLPYLAKCFSNIEYANYIYTVLQVLPEEIHNNELVVEEDKRVRIRKYLKLIQRQVLIQLNNVGAMAWSTQKIKPRTLLKCFSNWINLKIDTEVLESLPQHYLLTKAFQEIEASSVNTECILVIKNTIRSIETPQKNPQLYKFLASRIIEFFTLIKNKKDKELFLCEDYVFILSTFARASRQEFIQNLSNDYVIFLDNMLEISSVEEFATMPLITFWQRFLSAILPKQSAIKFYRSQLRTLFTTFSKTTAFSLFECTQLNDKSTYILEKQNGDFAQKMQIRRELEDIFKFLAEALGHKQCLDIALNNITKLDLADKYFWPRFECFLNPLELVIDKHTELSNELDQLVLKLIEIASPYVIVQKTFIRILSNCVNLYSQNPEISLKIFNLLVSHLNNPDMEITVSRAMQYACTNNYQFVLDNVESFIQIVKKYPDNDRILKGVMIALTKDIDKLNGYFPIIFQKFLEELSGKTVYKEIKNVLENIIIMFKEITDDNPIPYSQVVSQCFAQLWKSLKQILQKQCTTRDDESLLQRVTKLIKYALRCLKQCFHPFMDDLYTTILEAYTHYPMGSYVYLVEVLVTIFNQSPELFQPITLLFQKVCQITLSHFSKLKDIQSNQSVSQDFFGMLSRFMRFIPQIVNNFPQFSSLLHLANLGCGIQNGKLARGFYAFIQDMYMQFWDIDLVRAYQKIQKPMDPVLTQRSEQMYQSRQKIRQLVFNNTFQLMTRMIQHLSDVPTSSVRHCIQDALIAEVKAFPNENRELWFSIFQGIPEKILTNTEKNKFLEMLGVLTEGNLDDLEEIIELISKRYMHESIRSPIN